MPRITFRMEVDGEDSQPPPAPPLGECFPELTPVDELKATLRRFNVAFANDVSHEELLRLYRQVLCPKPQRTTARSNRRGQQIQMKQIRQQKAAKRKAEVEALGGTTAKNAKIFAPAQSVNNANNSFNYVNEGNSFNTANNKFTLNLDPVNGRLKPAPSLKGKTTSLNSESKTATVNSLDTLAHIKINEGPTRKRDKGGGGDGDGGGGEGGGGELAVSAKTLANADNCSKERPTIKRDGKFWNMFGSISCDTIVSSSTSSSLSSSTITTPKTSALTLPNSESPSNTEKDSNPIISLSTAPKRVLKLNRKTVLPQEVADLTQRLQQQQEPHHQQQHHQKQQHQQAAIPLKSSSPASSSPMNGSPRFSPANQESPRLSSPTAGLSDSGSDMDVSESVPVKTKKGIAKISWP